MAEELPKSVRIREVGPRDGFQNEPEVIPTEEKIRLIGLLGDSGLKRIEVTSFVRPDVIPQLADGAEVLTRFEPRQDVAYSVLIPNRKGSTTRFRCATAFRRRTSFSRRPRPITGRT